MVKHVILWNLKDEFSDEEKAQIKKDIKDGLEGLKGQIPGLTEIVVNIEPLAKMRNQLARRHSSVFGMFFSATDYTVPAEILVGYMAPQLIVLWTKMDIEFCLKNSCFIPCMKEKYRRAVENCEYNYAFYLEHTEFEKLPSEPLF